jgi:hypothetical protein
VSAVFFLTFDNCRSTVIPPLINPVTNDIVVNESDKANVLNNYFCYISFTLFLRILYIFRLCTVGEDFNFLCKRSRIII